MLYRVEIEAQGYGDAGDDFAALTGVLPENDEELAVEVGVDEGNRMLLTVFTFEAESGYDAQAQGRDLWYLAWRSAFPDEAETAVFAIKALPSAQGPSPDALPVAAGESDPLHDIA